MAIDPELDGSGALALTPRRVNIFAKPEAAAAERCARPQPKTIFDPAAACQAGEDDDRHDLAVSPWGERASERVRRGSNNLVITWTDPPEIDRAPIVAARYKLCAAGGGHCSRGEQTAPGIARFGVRVPSPGVWTLSLWRCDAAGDETEAAASVPVTLRYDPEAPQLRLRGLVVGRPDAPNCASDRQGLWPGRRIDRDQPRRVEHMRALAGRVHRRPDDPDVQDACSEAWTIAMRAPGAPLHDPDHLDECLIVTAIRADSHAYKGTENRSALALKVSVLIACPGASDT